MMLRITIAVLVAWLAAGAAAQARELALPITTPEAAETVGLVRPWVAQLSTGAGSKLQDLRLVDGVLFAVTDTGRLQALDAETGHTLWATEFGNPNYPTSGVGVGAKHVAATNGSTLYVFSRETGGQLSAQRLRYPPSTAAPVVGDRWIYVSSLTGTMETAWAPKSLQEREAEKAKEKSKAEKYIQPPLWRSSGGIHWPPVLTSDRVVWTTDAGYVYGASIDDLLPQFRFRTGGAITAPPAVREPVVIAASDDGFVYAIDSTTGEMQWQLSLTEAIHEQPVVVGDNVYLVPEGLGMYCLATGTGDVRWVQPGIVQFVAASPTLLYTVDALGRLLVQNPASGAVLGALDASRLTKRLSNADTDRIYLASADGLVECLREVDLDAPAKHGAAASAEEATSDPKVAGPTPAEAAPTAPPPMPEATDENDPFR